MANFDSGVSWYSEGIVSLSVYFPEGQTKCQYCRFIRGEQFLKRQICLLTDEFILDPFSGRGRLCPIQFKEDTD